MEMAPELAPLDLSMDLSILSDFYDFGHSHGMDDRLLYQLANLRMQLDKSFELSHSHYEAALLVKAKAACALAEATLKGHGFDTGSG